MRGWRKEEGSDSYRLVVEGRQAGDERGIVPSGELLFLLLLWRAEGSTGPEGLVDVVGGEATRGRSERRARVGEEEATTEGLEGEVVGRGGETTA